ncbi:MAG: DUF2956 domain-containing protein [Gammaproteobacteria bacterium]|nr:DUF2956 domain-containing protein [Gammaproteobacteria bacterium]
MAKYSKRNNVSEQSKDDAMKIARGTQKPGQTKEQTKLIAQGIQKGIELYKKKNNEKSRELDKKLKKVSGQLSESPADNDCKDDEIKANNLPWILLALSWFGFVAYVVLVD